MTHRQWVAVALVALCGNAARAGAQTEKLAGHFPAAAESSLRAVIDSARAEALPLEPLVQRALEGARRGVEPARVVEVVRALRVRLGTARRSLGSAATEAELVAAASAIYVGVSADTLAQLRQLQQGRSIALPLVVLADMVQQGVPRDTATQIILSFTRAGIDDEGYQTLRQAVLLDIRSGVPAAAAAATRARGALLGRPRISEPPPGRGQRPPTF